MHLAVTILCVLCCLFLFIQVDRVHAASEATSVDQALGPSTESDAMPTEDTERRIVLYSSPSPSPFSSVAIPTQTVTSVSPTHAIVSVGSTPVVTLPNLKGLLSLPFSIQVLICSLFIDANTEDLRMLQRVNRAFRAASREPMIAAKTRHVLHQYAHKLQTTVTSYTRRQMYENGFLKPRGTIVVPIEQLFILQVVTRLFDPMIAGYAEVTPKSASKATVVQVDSSSTDTTESTEEEPAVLAVQHYPSREALQSPTAPLSDSFLTNISNQITLRVAVPLASRPQHCLLRLVDILLATPVLQRPSPAYMMNVFSFVFTAAHTLVKPQLFIFFQRHFRELERELVPPSDAGTQ